MDPLTYFIGLLTVFAFGIPLLLIGAHMSGRGWTLGLPLYAGIVECLATYAVIARGSGFFESQIGDISAGYLSKDAYVALGTAFMGSLALVVFGWAIPEVRQAIQEIVGQFKSLVLPRRLAPTSTFALDLEEATPLNAFARAGIWLTQLLWAATRVCLGSLFLLAYFGWPAVVLEMERHHQAEAALSQQELSAAAERARSARRHRAREAAARGNELHQGLERRRDTCGSDDCRDAWQRRISDMQTDFRSLGLTFSSHFDSDVFADKLGDDDKLESVHTKIDDLARKHRIRLSSTSSRRVVMTPDLIKQASGEEARKRDNDARVTERVFFMAGNPREIFASLSRDITTLLCVLMEAIAVLLGFAVPLRKES